MTNEEAKNILVQMRYTEWLNVKKCEALDKAINAINVLEKYEELGTVEELEEAIEMLSY